MHRRREKEPTDGDIVPNVVAWSPAPRITQHQKDDGFRVVTPLHPVIRRTLLSGAVAATLALGASNACEPTVSVGRVCPKADAAASPDPSTPVPMPWTTGFETEFCDYALPLGFCFATGSGSFAIVTSPVHSGHYAAAFTVSADGDGGGAQARCVQQGVFPNAAYYGAWYYVPEAAVNGGLWNLFHFQSAVADGGQPLHGLWDVSLANSSDGGGLQATLFDFLPHAAPTLGNVPPIPIGQWFHLELYFRRAKTATGEITLWQDGVKAADLTGLVTDDADWGQFYVGNLATALLPPASTVYVDDVTIAAGP